MPPDLADQPGADLLRWMDPLASDVIAASYAHASGAPDTIDPLLRCHVLLWRSLLTGRDDAGTFRRELSRLVGLAGVSETFIENVDRQVLAELLDTVASRYTRSPREASRLSFLVARAACRLAHLRPVDDRGRIPGSDSRPIVRELALAKGDA